MDEKEKKLGEAINRMGKNSVRGLGRALRRRPLLRKTLNFFSHALIFPYAMSRTRNIPKIMQVYLDKSCRVGLLEDAILSSELYIPGQEEKSLQYEKADGGRWVAYDFHRKAEFGERSISFSEGILVATPLEEVINNPPDALTPTYIVDILDLSQFFQMTIPTIEELFRWGLIEEVAYGEAFRRVGLYDKYSRAMHVLEIMEVPLYSVTPKGNGLIFILGEGGEKSENKGRTQLPVPAFGW